MTTRSPLIGKLVKIANTMAFQTIATIIFMAGPLSAMFVEYGYQQSNPKVPDARTGHIYPHNVHGSVRYYSEHELHVLRDLWMGGALFGLAVGAFVKYVR